MAFKTTPHFAGLALDEITYPVGGGRLRGWSGSAPSKTADSPTGTLLFDAEVSDMLGAFPSASGDPPKTIGRTAGSPATFAKDTSADATGTVGYFRLTDAMGTAMMQGSVGLTGSGADLILSSLAVTIGDVISITQFDITLSGVT